MSEPARPAPLPGDASGLPADPFELLRGWLAEAADQGMRDPAAMTLATAGADGRPSARSVLMRGFDERGLCFHTNRGSLKGRQLAENPRAQLLFFWRELGRQVLVHGEVSQLSDEESDAYFATRPRGARLAAWASDQARCCAAARSCSTAGPRPTPASPATTSRAPTTGAATA